MQMFEPSGSRFSGAHDNVLPVSDGRVAGTRLQAVTDELPSATGLYLPCRLRNETTVPPSFGPPALSGQQQDAGRARSVPVASEVATDTRHGRRFLSAEPVAGVLVQLGTSTPAEARQASSSRVFERCLTSPYVVVR